MKVQVLMHATTRPYGGKELLMGEVYHLSQDYAGSLVKRGLGEIIAELTEEDKADAVSE